MNMLNQLALLQRMDNLINRKGTGTAEELADRLGICRRSVFNYFERLKDYGADIAFNFEKNSYFYVNDQRPSLPIIAKQNANRLNGGNNFNNFFLGVQVFCTPALDLCPKLIHNEEHNEASRYRFSEWEY